MTGGRWIKDLPVAVTVCDAEGIITEMNESSCKAFEKSGGRNLIGKSVLDCHPEKARKKIEELLKNRTDNCYTIEKNGVKTMVYQAPWYKDGEFAGFVEFLLKMPAEMPHYLR